MDTYLRPKLATFRSLWKHLLILLEHSAVDLQVSVRQQRNLKRKVKLETAGLKLTNNLNVLNGDSADMTHFVILA